jgi:hypothetical protein
MRDYPRGREVSGEDPANDLLAFGVGMDRIAAKFLDR